MLSFNFVYVVVYGNVQVPEEARCPGPRISTVCSLLYLVMGNTLCSSTRAVLMLTSESSLHLLLSLPMIIDHVVLFLHTSNNLFHRHFYTFCHTTPRRITCFLPHLMRLILNCKSVSGTYIPFSVYIF